MTKVTKAHEFVRGRWVVDSGEEPEALVVWADEPSPETGHEGWCWWAQGRMGDAPTLAEAKARAEAALKP